MIRFGTSGWRAVISDEFTFENVRRVTRAIAAVLRETPGLPSRGVAVGYDTRFLSESFAAEAARVLSAEGIPVRLSAGALPTPVLAFSILDLGLAGGLNVTASHNPPEYNGLKFSTADGASAPPEVTARIESLLAGTSGDSAAQRAAPLPLEPRSAYFARLCTLVERDRLARSGLVIGFDGRFGTTRGWLDRFLEESGVRVVRINDRRDPLFGGHTPDCSGDNISELRRAVVEQGLDLGLATDGDGDRFGVVDRDGRDVTPNLILALLVDYLAETRGWTGGVGRTVATTHLIDRIAAARGFPVHETPVGFKYFQPLLAQGQIFMACEESAGMSVRGHVPEKDGILAGLLVAEMVAVRGVSLASQVGALFARFGVVLTRRVDRRFPPERRPELQARLAQPCRELAGMAVERIVTVDGTKWIRVDGSWLLIRVSGTEPVVRIYAEAGVERDLSALLEAGVALVP